MSGHSLSLSKRSLENLRPIDGDIDGLGFPPPLQWRKVEQGSLGEGYLSFPNTVESYVGKVYKHPNGLLYGANLTIPGGASTQNNPVMFRRTPPEVQSRNTNGSFLSFHAHREIVDEWHTYQTMRNGARHTGSDKTYVFEAGLPKEFQGKVQYPFHPAKDNLYRKPNAAEAKGSSSRDGVTAHLSVPQMRQDYMDPSRNHHESGVVVAYDAHYSTPIPLQKASDISVDDAKEIADNITKIFDISFNNMSRLAIDDKRGVFPSKGPNILKKLQMNMAARRGDFSKGFQSSSKERDVALKNAQIKTHEETRKYRKNLHNLYKKYGLTDQPRDASNHGLGVCFVERDLHSQKDKWEQAEQLTKQCLAFTSFSPKVEIPPQLGLGLEAVSSWG